MDIRFISSLTPADEARVAAAICGALGTLLSEVPLAYMLRVRTSDGQIFEQRSPHSVSNPLSVAAASDGIST
jgi:hypothetical protein